MKLLDKKIMELFVQSHLSIWLKWQKASNIYKLTEVTKKTPTIKSLKYLTEVTKSFQHLQVKCIQKQFSDELYGEMCEKNK